VVFRSSKKSQPIATFVRTSTLQLARQEEEEEYLTSDVYLKRSASVGQVKA